PPHHHTRCGRCLWLRPDSNRHRSRWPHPHRRRNLCRSCPWLRPRHHAQPRSPHDDPASPHREPAPPDSLRSQPWAAPTDATDIPRIRWFELTQTGFTLHATPLDVAGPLADYRAKSGAAWVFTSATLAVAGSFDHFAAQVGLEEPATLLEASPFDYT